MDLLIQAELPAVLIAVDVPTYMGVWSRKMSEHDEFYFIVQANHGAVTKKNQTPQVIIAIGITPVHN